MELKIFAQDGQEISIEVEDTDSNRRLKEWLVQSDKYDGNEHDKVDTNYFGKRQIGKL